MTIANFIEQCHNDYDTARSRIIDIQLNVPEELGDEMYIDTSEQFLWVKIALIRKHVEECQ
jgi:hypothetical protein